VIPSITVRAAMRALIGPSFSGRDDRELHLRELVGVDDRAVSILIATLEADDADLVDRVTEIDEELRPRACGIHLRRACHVRAAVVIHAVGLIDGDHAVEGTRFVVLPAKALRLRRGHTRRRRESGREVVATVRFRTGRNDDPCLCADLRGRRWNLRGGERCAVDGERQVSSR
jgi:hypothetical protein